MARRPRKRSNKDESPEMNTEVQNNPTALSANVAKMLQPVGFTKAPTKYTISDVYEVPPVVFRRVVPWAALRGGFRLEANSETDDTWTTASGIDPDGIDGIDLFRTTLTDYKSTVDGYTLEPATPIADYFTDTIWPYYDRLFRTSVKQSGTLVTYNSFIAINILIIKMVSLIKDYLSLEAVSKTELGPLWTPMAHIIEDAYGFSKKAQERRILNAIDIASRLPAIKGIISEITRIKSPFVPVGASGTLYVPIESNLESAVRGTNNTVATGILTEIEKIQDILRGEYSEEIAAMKRHMPYTLADSSFLQMMPPTVDPFKTDGVLNSTFQVCNISGNNGDPAITTRIILQQDATAQGFLPSLASADYTGYTQYDDVYTTVPGGMPALSFVSMSLWLVDNDVVDAAFALLTPHLWASAVVPSMITYNMVTMNPFLTKALTTGKEHLASPLLRQAWNDGDEDFFMPFAKRSRLDLDACVQSVYNLLQDSYDLEVVGKVDTLSQTSSAPVTHPAVAAVRAGE